LPIKAGLIITALGAAAAVVQLTGLLNPDRTGGGTAAADRNHAGDVLAEYCIDCHDALLKSGGLTLELEALRDIAGHAEVWEKVAHKLRAGSMPPLDEPRPTSSDYERVADFLETALDTAAVRAPMPGRLPQLHRLTRTEYRHAIRDLLALGQLPAEMDFELLLPADNASSGFDNIADLLFVSPVIMERYLDAARKISRLAVGDPGMPVIVNRHRLPLELPQDEHRQGLPFGTRGGLVTGSYFPLDAEYVFHVELARRAREPHEIEITIDGGRAAAATVGLDDAPQEAGAIEFRVPVSAGPHVVGATFVTRTEALDESTVRVQRRSRGTQPAIELVTISGPYAATGPGTTPSRERIFVCRPQSADEGHACAREILGNLARRAYRRPVTAADIDALWPFFEEGSAARGFEGGVQRALERLLVSPQFLYRIERIPAGTPAGTAFEISPIELASRLSFFLWSSLPDDELLAVAESGRLTEPAVLEAEITRMLDDPRSAALVDNFAAQWLFLGDVAARDPDVFLFRDYDEGLREAFVEETKLFVSSVFRERRSVLELITADYTFLNERLAEHYGVPYIAGSHFRRVDLPAGSPRGGLLGHGSVLTLTSYPTRTSPVLRGKYVLDNLLAAPPPPPPPDVPALEAGNESDGAARTLREAMAAHRENPECASCHAQMDPIGFAFEHFDAVGRWREADNGLPILDASELPDGTTLDGIDGVRRLLLERPERFVAALTEKLLMYAIGRNVQYYDAPAVRTIVREAAAEGYTFESIVRAIAGSVPFRMRLAPGAETVHTAGAGKPDHETG
jgi:mono/diheme cytochrome c family protein